MIRGGLYSHLPIVYRDIDLLECRSFAVVHRCVNSENFNCLSFQLIRPLVHRFTDSEVLAPDFKEKLAAVARVMQPLVRWYVF
jgi:hypothetical protein